MASRASKFVEYVFIPGRMFNSREGWPVYSARATSSAVIGVIQPREKFMVSRLDKDFVKVHLHSGVVGWALAILKGNRYLHIKDEPPGPAIARRRVQCYGWQRARGGATNYEQILEKRRAQLRQVELDRHPELLKEWMELIRELDAVLRYGFTSKLDVVAIVSDVKRSRSKSFLGFKKPPPSTPMTTTTSKRRSRSFQEKPTKRTDGPGDLPPLDRKSQLQLLEQRQKQSANNSSAVEERMRQLVQEKLQQVEEPQQQLESETDAESLSKPRSLSKPIMYEVDGLGASTFADNTPTQQPPTPTLTSTLTSTSTSSSTSTKSSIPTLTPTSTSLASTSIPSSIPTPTPNTAVKLRRTVISHEATDHEGGVNMAENDSARSESPGKVKNEVKKQLMEMASQNQREQMDAVLSLMKASTATRDLTLKSSSSPPHLLTSTSAALHMPRTKIATNSDPVRNEKVNRAATRLRAAAVAGIRNKVHKAYIAAYKNAQEVKKNVKSTEELEALKNQKEQAFDLLTQAGIDDEAQSAADSTRNRSDSDAILISF